MEALIRVMAWLFGYKNKGVPRMKNPPEPPKKSFYITHPEEDLLNRLIESEYNHNKMPFRNAVSYREHLSSEIEIRTKELNDLKEELEALGRREALLEKLKTLLPKTNTE